MKHFKPLIIYLSILSIITLAIFANNPLKVYAEVPATQKAVAHEGTWTGYNFDVDIFGKYWTIEDISEIPINSFTGNQYYYTFDNIKFTNISASEVYGLILTRGMGLVYAPNKLAPLLQAFLAEISTPKYSGFVQGGVYDGSNNLIGYALNDITGCYYEGITISNDTPYTVPDNQVDNVYNFFEYYTGQSTTVPDYFTYTCPTDNYIAQAWNVNNNSYHPDYEEGRINNYNVIRASYDNCLDFKLGVDPSTKQIQNSRTWYGNSGCSYNFTDYDEIVYISSSNESTWSNYCNDYQITKEDNTLLFTDLVTITEEHKLNYSLEYQVYNTNNLQQTNTRQYVMSINVNTPNINYTDVTNNFYLGVATGTVPSAIYYSQAINTPTGENITIFKDITTYNSLVVNKTYNNDYYKSTTYNNYDTTNDNSFTVNYSSVVNSTTNNTTIYNDTQDIFYDNVDNGGSIVVPAPDITIIINNIIPDYTEPDPDDPSGGGGGSGGSGDEDINDDNVLSALLAAIRHFFQIIGRLIGTILTGLLEVINAILESITGIMESMSGVTDFITALFSWIPEPVPQVLGLAISITILCALIRFIRG